MHSTSDGTSYQLAEEINDCVGPFEPPAPTVFYDETFTITVESGDNGAPTSKAECKKGGWKSFSTLGFKNQGDCVSYVATVGKNLPASGKENQ